MPKQRRRIVRTTLFLAGVVALLICLALAVRPGIRHTLSHCTGEEDLQEQIKGIIALAHLRLTRPEPQTAPLVPIAHTGVPPYGVNTFLQQEVEADKVERSLQVIAQAGFTWIRQQFPWEDIEIAGKGDYRDPKWGVNTWEKYDRIVTLAQKHSLQIIARLDAPPAWTRKMGDAPGWTMAPPDNLEDYGDFVHAVVSRYRGRIRYYQIWNEPNIYPEWGDRPADPAGYVALLQVAYRRAKEADPDCVIICAGLAQTTEETPLEFKPRNMSDLLYLEGMYQAGVRGYFDIMGAQVYGLFTGPYDRRVSRDRSNFPRVQLLREIMVRYGDTDKPIWATEMGWNAVPVGFPLPAAYGRVSEMQQALYAAEGYQRAAQEWPWMGVINYWFLRRPSDAEKGQVWYYFRMLEPDFRPLPVYDALAAMASRAPVVSMGYHQEDHWALRYQGPWEQMWDDSAVLGGYARGHPGATLAFTVQGAVPLRGMNLALLLREPTQIANMKLLIDGLPTRPCSRCGAPPFAPGGVIVVRGLSGMAPHRLQLTVDRDRVELDSVIVWPTATPGWLWVAMFAVTLIGPMVLGRWWCLRVSPPGAPRSRTV